MRYDNLRAFEKHLEGAKLLKLSPLYCILGKETYECQEAIELLLQILLPAGQPRELGLFILEGSQLEELALNEALYSFSLFSKQRVLWIQQCEKLKKNVQEKLEKYFAHPIPSQYILLSATQWQKSHPFYKFVEKEGIVLEFAELKPWEKEKKLAEWVNKQMTAQRKLVSFQVCQSLVKRIGVDQIALSQEIEKLLCYCFEKKEITQSDIEAICPTAHHDSVWQLGEALFRRDASTAISIAQNLLLEGQPFLPLLRQIRSQFQTEYQISLLLSQGKQAQDITLEFPYMKGQILERHMRYAQQYGVESFKCGLIALDTMEMRSKNSAIDEKILIEILIMQLTL